jgi:serine/threonine protein kinase
VRDPQDYIGQQVGEYRVLRLLGKGTFGAVYLAQSLHEQTLVALKLLRMPLTHQEDLKDFLNEARTIQLRHPHIVPLLDFGLSRNGLPFLVMEYAAGGTLRDCYPRGTRLPLESISLYVNQLASALHYAHTHRVIHRDIKPENMLLRADGTILLSDFGIARVLDYSSTGSALTQAGTPAYMAPEQSQGKPCAASDQYALATVVYEWIAGRLPFQGTPLEVMVQHRLDVPPSLCAQRQDVTAATEQVIFRALAKTPEERFATSEQFAQALQGSIQPAARLLRQLPASPAPSASSPMPLWPAPPQTLAASAPALPEPQLTAPAKAPLTTQASVTEISPPELPFRQFATPPSLAAQTILPARRRTVAPWRITLLIMLALLLISGGALSYFTWLTPGRHLSIGTLAPVRTHPRTTPVSTPTRVSFSGRNIAEFDLPTSGGEPYVITAGPDGNLWFTESFVANKIGRITPGGSVTEFTVPTPLSGLDRITAGPDGNLWFTEYDGNRIGRITPSGSITEFAVPTSRSAPFWITTGPDSNLWFTENDAKKIGYIMHGK